MLRVWFTVTSSFVAGLVHRYRVGFVAGLVHSYCWFSFATSLCERKYIHRYSVFTLLFGHLDIVLLL